MAGEGTPQTVVLKVAGADGAETEVQVPREAVLAALGGEYLPKDTIGKELDRRVASIVKNKGLRTVDEFLSDDEVIAKVLEANKHKAGAKDEPVTPEQIRAAVAEARKEWEAKELSPLKESNTKLTAREEELLVRDMERQIIQAAAAAGVKPALLKSPRKGVDAPIVAMLRDVFAFDAESGEFFVADGDHFAFDPQGNNENPYKTIARYLEDWVGDKDNAEFVVPGQGGAGVSGNRGGGRPTAGFVELTQEQANDQKTFQAALEKVGGDYTKLRIQRPGGI